MNPNCREQKVSEIKDLLIKNDSLDLDIILSMLKNEVKNCEPYDNYTKEEKGKEESPIESVPDNRVMTAGTRTIEREGKKSAETKEDKRQKRRLPIVKILAFAILLFIVIYAASFVLLKAIKGEKEHSKTNHQIENTILQE